MALARIRQEGGLTRYYLLHASLGEFHMRAGDYGSAREYFKTAARMCRSVKEKEFLLKRITLCELQSA